MKKFGLVKRIKGVCGRARSLILVEISLWQGWSQPPGALFGAAFKANLGLNPKQLVTVITLIYICF